MQNCRLIYRSVSAADVVTNKEITDLVEQATVNNLKLGITGLLLLSGNRFLQVLEGPFSEVNHLFRRILIDERHRDVELIDFSALEKPYFQEWGMHLADLYDLPLGPREILAAKYPNNNGQIDIPNDLPTVFSLLLDARAVCLTTPWQPDGSSDEGTAASRTA